jgi:hypothetical protein
MNPGMGIGSPVSNDVYNVIAALDNKLEGLEAYRKFAQDQGTNVQIWQQIAQLDQQCVQLLLQELNRLGQSGRLTMQGQPQMGNYQGSTLGTTPTY